MKKEEHHLSDPIQRLPKGIALSWGLEKEPQRGPKRELTLQQIVNTAIQIADKEGLPAVSMNRVAKSLGYTAMSLYRYISSKDDLLLLMQDAVCNIPIPAENSAAHWREQMREYTQTCLRTIWEHPWFVDLPIWGEPMTPNHMQFVEWPLRIMRDFPLTDREKMSMIILISSYVRAWGSILRDSSRAEQETGVPESQRRADLGSALLALASAERYPHLYPLIESGTYTEENETESKSMFGHDFDFGLERILDGIEHYIQK
ncbi:TetR/AcrR family transcriptional regulator [Marinicrinis lubricantis]|uniref:TetR/AcrR family transcriptional regulator n=1 Tax=Marinicrinis lubricantis TaxID=2086470 RepID=A0ABW1IKM6_9BACL